MEKLRCKAISSGNKTLFITLIIALLAALFIVSPAVSANGQADRQKIVEQLAARWIQIGQEQYERNYYKAAEQSFLKAKDYEQYLNSAERERLNSLLEKAHQAATESEQVSGDIARAQQLLADGRLAEARELFESVRDSKYLDAQTREIVEQGLAQTKDNEAVRRSRIAEIYNESVDYYNAGELEKAREGFLDVARSDMMIAPEGSRAEDYLAKIDAALAQQSMEQNGMAGQDELIEEELFVQPEQDTPEVQTQPQQSEQPQAVKSTQVSEPAAELREDDGYIEVIKRRRSILRSHTEAVVKDALAKARSNLSEDKFEQARNAIEYAQNIVNKNRQHLGEELFTQYSNELQNRREQINAAEQTYQEMAAKKARIQAEQQHEKIRTEMAMDRKERVEELMENAMAYQKQQRYEEALGQLQSLLAIDPLNQQALIMRDTLTDTISFRKQLEVVKEQQRERAALLLETSKSSIPYADEMTISKDWLEISAKRQPEEAIGQDPDTAKAYEQLEEVVELSQFNPDMPFSEAIEILRNSVDPPLRIFVNWRDLYDNADIDRSTPINIDPISSIKLSSALRLLLESVSGGFVDLGYGVENGVITIATEESIPADLITLVYDVTDLVGVPAEYRIETTGGGGGGGGSVTDAGGGFQDQGGDEQLGRDELREERLQRITDLIYLIQDTVAPDSWATVGGEGTVTNYSSRLLSIRQNTVVHNEIAKLLEELRKAHGYQIAIEARFLKVRENFLEDIGLDIDFLYSPGGKFSDISFNQNSARGQGEDSPGLAASSETGVTGSLGGAVASVLTGGYGTALDDLQVTFLLQATQGHEDATLVTAPKATVLSGESASFRIEKTLYYASDIEIETAEAGDQARGFVTVNYTDSTVTSGTIMNITPTIAPDKKHVLLNIDVQLNDFLGFRNQIIDSPSSGDIGGGQYTIPFPEVETSQVRTRVSVPDGGTLLLGGQKLSAEVNREIGVPVLSKIPILGRAFGNRSKVKDHMILLILVKPTIILQEEIEADAVAELKASF